MNSGLQPFGHTPGALGFRAWITASIPEREEFDPVLLDPVDQQVPWLDKRLTDILLLTSSERSRKSGYDGRYRIQLVIEPVDLSMGPVLLQMSNNGLIGTQRLPRPPYRFRHWSRTLRTSSSGTNSPLSACSSPLRTDALTFGGRLLHQSTLPGSSRRPMCCSSDRSSTDPSRLIRSVRVTRSNSFSDLTPKCMIRTSASGRRAVPCTSLNSRTARSPLRSSPLSSLVALRV